VGRAVRPLKRRHYPILAWLYRRQLGKVSFIRDHWMQTSAGLHTTV